MTNSQRQCSTCGCTHVDKGRGHDGRRCYRCQNCGTEWSEGNQGRERTYSPQRDGFQFADTGAAAWGKSEREWKSKPGKPVGW